MESQKNPGNLTLVDRLAEVKPRDPNLPKVTRAELDANPGAFREKLIRGELLIVPE